MTEQVKAIPEGFHTLTPHLIVRDASRAIEFYKNAFGAEELGRVAGPDGKSIMHAELKVGDSMLFLCDEFAGMNHSPQSLNGTSITLSLYVEDCDAVFNSAVAAGATVQMPLEDQFWGDRYGKVIDPFGHEWGIATHIQDIAAEDLSKAAEAAMAQMSSECK